MWIIFGSFLIAGRNKLFGRKLSQLKYYQILMKLVTVAKSFLHGQLLTNATGGAWLDLSSAAQATDGQTPSGNIPGNQPEQVSECVCRV